MPSFLPPLVDRQQDVLPAMQTLPEGHTLRIAKPLIVPRVPDVYEIDSLATDEERVMRRKNVRDHQIEATQQYQVGRRLGWWA